MTEKVKEKHLKVVSSIGSCHFISCTDEISLGFTKYEPGGLRYEYFDTAEKILVVWAIIAVVFYLLYRARKSKYTMAVWEYAQ